MDTYSYKMEKQSSRAFTGVYATRKVCLQVPLFFLYGLALYLPPVRALFRLHATLFLGDRSKRPR